MFVKKQDTTDAKSNAEVAKTEAVPKRASLSLLTKSLIALVVLGIVGYLAYGYVSTRNELKRLTDEKAASKSEIVRITELAGKVLQLPTDDTPVLATVNDAIKLNNPEAQNGDEMVIYGKSSKAILYRPSTKKIIQYAPINLGTK